jgi:cell division protein FtsZ
MFDIIDQSPSGAIIKVIGVGGCGGNAINYMIEKNITGVEFICANTDMQALHKSLAKHIVQLGPTITRGLGAGANPEIGRQAALEDENVIRDTLRGADMVFITAVMGGGTGTGAAPVIANIAKDLGILTVAVVTKPFLFENKRMAIAEAGIKALADTVDSLIIIPNEKLLEVLGGDCDVLEAFAAANDVLRGAVAGISEVINCPGLINVDFADVKAVMSEMGMAMMGSALASGADRARAAAEAAVASPLLEDIHLSGAKGILVNITASKSLKMKEYYDVMNTVKEFAAPDALVIVGTVIDDTMSSDLRVTVIATGLGQASAQEMLRVVKSNADETASESGGYDAYDTPTVMRAGTSNSVLRQRRVGPQQDTPAFLRQKKNEKQ